MSEVRAHYLNYLEGEVVCGVCCVDDLDLLGPQHRGHVAARDLLYGTCRGVKSSIFINQAFLTVGKKINCNFAIGQ